MNFTSEKRKRIGGESRKVGEHRPVVVFELEAFSEPKSLSRHELQVLMIRFETTVAVARVIGASQSFVSFRLNGTKKWCPKSKLFLKTSIP